MSDTYTNGAAWAQVQTAIARAQAGDADAPYAVLDALASLDAQAQAQAKRAFKEALGSALNLRDLAAALRAQRNGHPPAEAPREGAYYADRGLAGTPLLLWRKPSADGTVNVLLAHFVPRIVAERVRHRASGEVSRVFTVEIATPRGTLTVEVDGATLADDRAFYAALINAAGADLLLATLSAKRHLAEAAKALADPARERAEVFEFTGWHEQGGRLIYLSAGGAIGAETPATVDLSAIAAGAGLASLARFGPRDEGDEAFARAVEALAGPVRHCLGERVMLPQIAAVFLAPALRWAPIAELPVLHVVGATGKGKSWAARILQAFYSLDATALSWSWTQAAIEVVAASLRDCVLCIDDLKAATVDPGLAVRLMQRWADRRPRVRSHRSGAGLVGTPQIASLLISNGEDLPGGAEASVASRALFLRVDEGALNYSAFYAAEAAKAHLATLTARYIAWLIAQREALSALLAEGFAEARSRYMLALAGRTRLTDAGRVASSCALLEMGAALLTRFLADAGQWSQGQAAEWLEATRRSLEAAAASQAGMVDDQSAATLFLSAIAALLDSHEAEVVTVEEGKAPPPLAACSPERPGARLIGYRRGAEILLDPALALPAVRQWLQRQGMGRPLEPNGLYLQLRNGGYLARIDHDKTAVVHKIANGATRRLLVLRAEAVDQVGAEAGEDADAPRF